MWCTYLKARHLQVRSTLVAQAKAFQDEDLRRAELNETGDEDLGINPGTPPLQ